MLQKADFPTRNIKEIQLSLLRENIMVDEAILSSNVPYHKALIMQISYWQHQVL